MGEGGCTPPLTRYIVAIEVLIGRFTVKQVGQTNGHWTPSRHMYMCVYMCDVYVWCVYVRISVIVSACVCKRVHAYTSFVFILIFFLSPINKQHYPHLTKTKQKIPCSQMNRIHTVDKKTKLTQHESPVVSRPRTIFHIFDSTNQNNTLPHPHVELFRARFELWPGYACVCMRVCKGGGGEVV